MRAPSVGGPLRFVATALAFLAPFTTAAVVHAECKDPIASGCFDADQAWPHPGHSRFPTIGGTETVAPGQFGVGLVTSWVYRPVVLRIATPAGEGTRIRAVEQQYTPNILWSYGVTDRFEIDAAFPVTVAMTGEGTAPLTGGSALRGSGIRDSRFGFTYAFVPRPRVADDVLGNEGQPKGIWALTGRFDVTAPWGEADRFLGGRTVVFSPTIAADYRRKRWFSAAEAGARIRGFQEFSGAGTGPQGLLGLGLGYDFLANERLSVVAEGRLYPTLAPQRRLRRNGDGYDVLIDDGIVLRTPLEGTLGLRSGGWFGGDFAFDVAVGSGVSLGQAALGTPTLRALVGLRYAPLDRDSDGDGVSDKVDLCPREKEIRKPGGVRDGCTDPDPETVEFAADSSDAAPIPPPTPPPTVPTPPPPPPPLPPLPAPEPKKPLLPVDPHPAPKPPIAPDPAVQPTVHPAPPATGDAGKEQ
jgi:hypothetical protein